MKHSAIGIYLKSLKKAVMDYIGFAIIAVGLIGAILGQISGRIENRKISYVITFFCIILIIMGAWLSFLDLSIKENKELASSSSGIISSPSGIIYPCLISGGNVLAGSPDGLSFIDFSQGIALGIGKTSREQSHSSQNETDKIIVWMDNGRLKVSSTFKDRDGKILARIVGNEWNTAQKPLIFDRNFDDCAVEVIDVYGNVVLQINMTGSCARVSGVFYNNLGNITVNDNGIFLNPAQSIKISPIFVYPSERHLGERVHPKTPTTIIQKFFAFVNQIGS